MNEQPRIAAIGICSLNTVTLVDEYPPEGGYTLAMRIEHQPGGTTANSAVAAARLGAEVSLSSVIGEDEAGANLLAAFIAEGIDTSRVQRAPDQTTDESLVIVSRATGQRTIVRKQGARPSRGSTLDIDSLFSADVCLVDVDDLSLFRFLVDLPVHTNPTARLLGTMTYLAERPGPATDEILQRLDAVVGSARDAMSLTGTSNPEAALGAIQHIMRDSNLRFAATTTGPRGAFGASPDQIWHVEPHRVNALDTTGAEDAFAGALAFGLALRLNPIETLKLCSIVAGLSTRQLGAQTSMPTMAEVREILEGHPPLVTQLKSTIES